MLVEVIAPNARIVIQTKGVDSVASETREIESDKIEIQSDDGFTFEVDPALWIERDGPGHEVDPTDDNAERLLRGKQEVIRCGVFFFAVSCLRCVAVDDAIGLQGITVLLILSLDFLCRKTRNYKGKSEYRNCNCNFPTIVKKIIHHP